MKNWYLITCKLSCPLSIMTFLALICLSSWRQHVIQNVLWSAKKGNYFLSKKKAILSNCNIDFMCRTRNDTFCWKTFIDFIDGLGGMKPQYCQNSIWQVVDSYVRSKALLLQKVNIIMKVLLQRDTSKPFYFKASSRTHLNSYIDIYVVLNDFALIFICCLLTITFLKFLDAQSTMK